MERMEIHKKRQASFVSTLRKGNYDCNESSFHGVTIDTSPQRLITLCELLECDYDVSNNGKDKSNFDFTFMTDDGICFTVYDWKEGSPLKMDRSYRFNLGGKSKYETLFARDKILEALFTI